MNLNSTAFIKNFPRVVRIEPASACNLLCSHCPTGTYKMKRGLMTEEIFTRIFEEIASYKRFVKVIVLYHGGEPFLNKKFTGMVKKTRKFFGNDLLIKTVSNGMLLSETVSLELIESGLNSIEISLDGQSAAENDTIRRHCNYETVISSVKGLIELKKKLRSETPEIIIASTQFLDPARHDGREDPPPPPYLLKEFTGKYAGGIAGYKCTWALHWPRMDLDKQIYAVYRDPGENDNRNYCDHVHNTITVRSNGDVVACCYDLTSQCVMGNVNEDSLAEIWNNERYLALRKSIHDYEYCEMCAGCAEVTPKRYIIYNQEGEQHEQACK